MKFTVSCPLEMDRGRVEGMAEGRWVHTVQGSSANPKTTVIHIFHYFAPSPHPPSPPPAWHWTTRALEGGRMCLSPPSVKTCHSESMQWFDATCWRDLWTAHLFHCKCLDVFVAQWSLKGVINFKLLLSLHNATIAKWHISLSQKYTFFNITYFVSFQ